MSNDTKVFNIKIEDELDKRLSIKEFVLEKLDEIFRDSLPINALRELPRPYFYFFGFLTRAIVVVVFILFFVLSYKDVLKQTFISLDSTAGNCETVDRPLSGSFYASYSGYWEGQEDFQSNEASYYFTFANLQFVTDPYDNFKSLLLAFQKEYLVPIGNQGYNQTLTTNLLYWMNYYYIFNTKVDTQQTFQFTGTPSAVFNAFFYQLSLSSNNGYCSAVLPSTYNSYSATLSTTITITDYDEYNCEIIVNPYYLGYSSNVLVTISFIGQSALIFNLDYNSFTTAVATNEGIVVYDYLVTLKGTVEYYTFNNVTYKVVLKVDRRYAGMVPVVCAENITDTAYDTISNYPITKYCFIYLRSINATDNSLLPLLQSIAIPVFNHYEDCYCLDGVSYGAMNVTGSCNQFDLISNLLTFPPNYSSPDPQTYSNITYNLLNLLSTYTQAQINNFTYYASSLSYANIAFTASSISYVDHFDEFKSYYEFCDYKCSLISTQSVINTGTPNDKGLYGGSVNSLDYQLFNGACNNSFNSPEWVRLASNPPVSLTESYYKCTPSSSSALSSTLGIAAGDTAEVSPLILFILLPGLYFVLNSLSIIPKKEKYSKEEKEGAMSELVELLLEMRDKNRGIESSTSMNDIINCDQSDKLVKELIEYASYKDMLEEKFVSKHTSKLKKRKPVIRKSIFNIKDSKPTNTTRVNPIHSNVIRINSADVGIEFQSRSTVI